MLLKHTSRLLIVLSLVVALSATFFIYNSSDYASAHSDSEVKCHTSKTVQPSKSISNRKKVKAGVWISRYCGGFTLKLNLNIGGEWQSPLVAQLNDITSCETQTYCRKKYTIRRDLARGCHNYKARARVWKWHGAGENRHLHLINAGETQSVRLCK